MTRPSALLDVDGTLVDSSYQHVTAWNRAFRDHGVVIPLWRLHRAIGMGGDRLVPAVAGRDVEEALGDALRAAHGEAFAAELAGGGPAVMVGDTVWDAAAAARVGIPTIGLLSGGVSAAELAAAGSAQIYSGADDLCERLDQSALAAESSSPRSDTAEDWAAFSDRA